MPTEYFQINLHSVLWMASPLIMCTVYTCMCLYVTPRASGRTLGWTLALVPRTWEVFTVLGTGFGRLPSSLQWAALWPPAGLFASYLVSLHSEVARLSLGKIILLCPCLRWSVLSGHGNPSCGLYLDSQCDSVSLALLGPFFPLLPSVLALMPSSVRQGIGRFSNSPS